MDLWTIIKIVVRRWYVTFPVLLAAAFAAQTVTSTLPPSYRATGSVILFVPNGVRTGSELPRNNPYLTFSGSLQITSHALVRVIGSIEQRETFQRQGLISDYAVQTEDVFPGIRFSVVGKDSSVVVRTGQSLIETIDRRLDALEEESGAPPEERIGVRVLESPRRAVEVPPAVARLAAVIVGLGVAAATALALALEALSRSRRARRRARSAVEPPATPVAAEETAVEPVRAPQPPATPVAAEETAVEPVRAPGPPATPVAAEETAVEPVPVALPTEPSPDAPPKKARFRRRKQPDRAGEGAGGRGDEAAGGDGAANGSRQGAERSDERVSASSADR